MRDKITNWLIIGIIVSVVMMIVGYFLWTNLVPLQDINSYSPQELRDIQKELAINYPLGSLLLNLGFVGFSSTLLALVVRKLLAFIKKKQ
ncbi:hypothetical protein SAMN04488100_1282 [Alkalibacterium putridalgicola]|uniref:Uncharacterized protein n=1 Tax=Alkalibacterium putridalgicola TaxID=426703 RepID=A0A1H7VX96_9LACT|nr:hypothetical protein [Alkalibacterium putridalgicola]GEK89392.1 hypothetical protein APU01nite_14310 [Alkalibacterium putridalgicola]SEM13415.1 hypothetical protein SAMN04488100_1282 [Alkalibacterium putridalgicola]